MSSATSDVTYTSVYTDSEPGRAFWGADDEEVPEGGIPRVIVLGYDGLPLQPVAPPSPDYVLGPENLQILPVPQDEDEREPMFIQAHDPDYVPEPIYPEYIPLEDDHEFLGSKESEDDKTRMDRVEVEDEEDEGGEEEDGALALADSYRLPSDPTSHYPFHQVARLRDFLAMTTPSPSPPYLTITTLCRALRIASTQALIDAVTAALPLPPLPLSLSMPSPVDRRDDIPESEQPPQRGCFCPQSSRFEIGEERVPLLDLLERDTWVDPAEAVPEIAPMTVGEVNTRVVGLAESLRVLQGLDDSPGDSMDGGRGGLCFPRGLGSFDRIGSGKLVHQELLTHVDTVYAYETLSQATRQNTSEEYNIQTQHQVHETRFHMQQTELEALEKRGLIVASRTRLVETLPSHQRYGGGGDE
ncbi:hypothetical protein Tco_1458413 [Tanacetum coccineum]